MKAEGNASVNMTLQALDNLIAAGDAFPSATRFAAGRATLLESLGKQSEAADALAAAADAGSPCAALAALRAELAQTRSALEDRKIIERAKGLIMKREGCDENTAFQILRSTAMDHSERLSDMARRIITLIGEPADPVAVRPAGCWPAAGEQPLSQLLAGCWRAVEASRSPADGQPAALATLGPLATLWADPS